MMEVQIMARIPSINKSTTCPHKPAATPSWLSLLLIHILNQANAHKPHAFFSGHDLNQGCAAIPQRVAIQPCSDETTGYRTFRSPVFLSIKVHRAYFNRHSTNTVNLSKSPGEADSSARIWAFTSEAFYRLGREAAFFRYQHVHTERLERVELMYILSMRL
jgi:hypothetical protein